MKIYDGHAHIGSEEEIRVREHQGITTFLCGTDPVSSEMVMQYCQVSECLIPVYGLHPWYADRFSVADMMPFIGRGALLGEIGMDSVWCTVSPDIQERVFREQLELAESLRMPVVLHTKGQEERVLSCIRSVTVPKLVHWYSSEAHLEEYAALDCYFTVGPDVRANPAVLEVVKKVPVHRLLAETDGFEAVRWAMGEQAELERLSDVLLDTMSLIAEVKQMELAQVAEVVEDNFNRFKNAAAVRNGDAL